MLSEKYDFICSLGGTCAVAHNLRYRGLRRFALPFDWIYFVSDDAIYQMAKSFKDGFKDYMLKDNLEEMSVNAAHPDKIQYYDRYAKIIWANQFDSKIEYEKEYKRVYLKFKKRFNRLIENIEKSDNILFIFSTKYQAEMSAFENLLFELKKIYPNKHFDIKVVSFSCHCDEQIIKDSIDISRYKRSSNLYDFEKTNFEWEFLDHININRKESRSKISFNLFKHKIKITWEKI